MAPVGSQGIRSDCLAWLFKSLEVEVVTTASGSVFASQVKTACLNNLGHHLSREIQVALIMQRPGVLRGQEILECALCVYLCASFYIITFHVASGLGGKSWTSQVEVALRTSLHLEGCDWI